MPSMPDGRQDLMLHVGHALHRNRPGRIGEVERIGLGMRLAARRIGK